MRRLVVTGDDFGISREVNAAIIEAHENGILTHASLMVTGEAFEEAVALARAHPRLAVGLHLVVIDGRSALPAAAVPDIVDGSGRFSSAPVRAGLRYQLRERARKQLETEIRAQLERFRATGLPLTHVDGHHHLHLHPVVLRRLASLAEEFPIPAIRLPSEELSLALRLDPRKIPTKLVWAWIFARLRRSGERRLRRAGVGFAERVYGLLATGRMTEKYLLQLIPRVRSDDVEVYSHPGANPDELHALVSPAVKRAVETAGFILSGTGGR